MPSDTFKNLKKEKKQKLLEAAMLEFSKESFNKASINNIINKAGISRGSFYVYFKDKEDLFQYVLYSYKSNFDHIMKKNLSFYNGNIREAFKKIFDDIINYIEKDNTNFFKNVFLNLNYQNKNFIVPHTDTLNRNNIKELAKYVDFSKMNIDVEDDMNQIIEILLGITIPSIIHSILKDIPLSIIKKMYYKKLDLVCDGIYRKEK